MKIAIYLDDPYPIGMANTNRVHLYARGLTELGNDVIVYVPKPFDQPGKVRNKKVQGIYDGVKYQYGNGTTVRSKSFLKRRMHDFVSPINTFRKIKSFNPSIILFISSASLHIILLKLYKLLNNVKVVREKSEVPFYHQDNVSFFQKLRLKIIYRSYDGMLVITESLKQFFHSDCKINAHFLVVPILIDTSKLVIEEIKNVQIADNLVYTGSLLDHKDGILVIIESFAKILERHPHLKLVMTGDLNRTPNKENILNLVKQLNLEDKIKFTGYISNEELQELTSTATALLLAKPLNRQNKFNMATKIGEYLLKSRPVVMSSVDPVCNYLSHRENAFIAKPDVLSFSKELEFILDNPEKASKIGEMGQKTALKSFDYKIHVQRIHQFLNQL